MTIKEFNLSVYIDCLFTYADKHNCASFDNIIKKSVQSVSKDETL